MLSFFYGAMNGGKSTLLLQRAHSYRSRGFRVVLISVDTNTRESGVRSRIGIESDVDIVLTPNSNVKDELNRACGSFDGITLVLVDESQFLTEPQVEQLRTIADENDFDVECYGLRTHFRARGFPGSIRLFELSDIVKDLDIARCRCGALAKFNARWVNSDPPSIVKTGPSVLIEGSTESYFYDATCSRCYHKYSAESVDLSRASSSY